MPRQEMQKGSWLWAARVAEIAAWGALVLVGVTLQLASVPATTERVAYAVVAALGAWLVVLFRVLIPRAGRLRSITAVNLAMGLGFVCAAYSVLRGRVPSAEFVFVPFILVTGLLGRLPESLIASVLSIGGFWVVGRVAGAEPSLISLVFTSGMFLLAGGVAGLLESELRRHFRGEQEEHRLATAVRLRLLAVLDAVDEGIVFSDRQGVIRVVNQRASEMFQLNAERYLGTPVVSLLRTVARETEDPEGFMEIFQQVRDDPSVEIRVEVEQILPARRHVRLYSGPARDDSGVLVGRIDVYSDITESVNRATEIEELYERARHTAESYQRALLPSAIPNLPRINLVAHYVPAAGRRAVCGDFYDVIALRNGRMGLVMGDVCGIGPSAVNDAALTRYTLRSFAIEESDPARLLGRLNAHLCAHLGSERFVRLLIVVLDPERAVLDYANAGHVPPLVTRARRDEVEWLGEGGLAIGVEPEAEFKSGRVELHQGDMLVMYTDGITEAARHGRPFGQGKLTDLARDYGMGTPGELVQSLRRAVDGWTTSDLRDDLALLVCQVVPDALIGEQVRELVVPNEPARVGELRAFVAAFLADLRAPVEVSTEIIIAVGEAGANAWKYGRRPGARSEIRLRCKLEGSRLTIGISDDGPGFDLRATDDSAPDPFAVGGRGLFLMRELMDSVDIETSPRGTTVTMSRVLYADGRIPRG